MSIQLASVEVEVLRIKLLRQPAGELRQHFIPHIRLQRIQIRRMRRLHHGRHVLRRCVVQLVHPWRMDRLLKRGKVHSRNRRLESRDRLHMIGLLRFSQVNHSHRSLRQLCLERHDVLGVLRRLLRGASRQLQHLRQMGDILLPQRLVLGSRAQVVILLRHPQSALDHHRNLLGRILEVLLLAITKEHIHADPLQLANQRRQLVPAGHRIDLLQQRLRRRQLLLVDQVRIHARLVVVADLLLIRRPPRPARRRLVQNSIQRLRIHVVQSVELIDRGLVSRDRMVRRKLAAGKFVEVVAWVHALVDRARIEARNRLVNLVRFAAVRRGLRLLRGSRGPGPCHNQSRPKQSNLRSSLACHR